MGPIDARTAARFWSKVAYAGPDACWLWTGGRHVRGYGTFALGGRHVLAHRVAWRLLRGPIPEGFHVHHLCAERLCVNPRHAAVITPREHARLGRSPSAINAQRTHCPRGHAYAGPNLYLYRGHRYCRACRTAYSRSYGREWRRRRNQPESRSLIRP